MDDEKERLFRAVAGRLVLLRELVVTGAMRELGGLGDSLELMEETLTNDINRALEDLEALKGLAK